MDVLFLSRARCLIPASCVFSSACLPFSALKVTQASGVMPIFAAQANSDSPLSHLLWMRMQCNAFSTLTSFNGLLHNSGIYE